jgi:hypothetical protein
MKTIDKILEVASTEEMSLARWMPSTVLLVVSHYRAVDKAPPFEYVKSFNSFDRQMFKDEDQPVQEELEWDKTLEALGIVLSDEYEEILQEYLLSGLLDEERLKTLFERYDAESINTDVSDRGSNFFTAFWWNPHLSEEELLGIARELLPDVNCMSPIEITDMVYVVEELGDPDLANQFLDDWLISIETRPEFQEIGDSAFDFHGRRKLHDRVVEKLQEMRNEQHPTLSLVEVTERILQNSGWGDRERIALRHSTIQKYEETLRDIKNKELRRFLVEHISWVRSGAYDEDFQIGADNFVAACYKICNEDSGSGLAKMISRIFEEHGLIAHLEPPHENAEPKPK